MTMERKEEKTTAKEYTESLEYLPDFMRDFHDQKDLFKSIEQLYENSDGYKQCNFNWRDSHIYTIDFFLWFMGQHGYKLQKIRKKNVQFFDIHKTIEQMIEKRLKAVQHILTPIDDKS